MATTEKHLGGGNTQRHMCVYAIDFKQARRAVANWQCVECRQPMPLAKTTLPCCGAEVRFRYNGVRVSRKPFLSPILRVFVSNFSHSPHDLLNHSDSCVTVGTIIFLIFLPFYSFFHDSQSRNFKKRTHSSATDSFPPCETQSPFTILCLVNFSRRTRIVSSSEYSTKQRTDSPCWASLCRQK